MVLRIVTRTLFSYLILTSGAINLLEGFKFYNQTYLLIIIFTFLDLVFIQFNLLVRLYFVFCKGTPHYLVVVVGYANPRADRQPQR